MRALLLSIVLITPGLSATSAEPAASGDGDLGRLQGRWTAMAGARKQVHVVLDVKGHQVSVAITTPQGLDFQVEGELKIDEQTTPRSLNWYNFTGPGDQPLPEIAGVYKVEGDTFTICNGGFNGPRPKEFKTGDSALADVVVFHRLGQDNPLVENKNGTAPPAPTQPDRAPATPTPNTEVASEPARAQRVASVAPAPAPASLVWAQTPVMAGQNMVMVRTRVPRNRRVGPMGLFAGRRRTRIARERGYDR